MRTDDIGVRRAPSTAAGFRPPYGEEPLATRPPGWVLHGSTAAVALTALDSLSHPGWNAVEWTGVRVVAPLVGLCWLARFSASALARHHRHLGWAAAPLALVIVLAAAATAAPLHARWLLSRSAFTTETRQAGSGQAFDGYPKRLGWFMVQGARRGQGADIVYFTGDHASFADGAIAFLPGGPSQDTSVASAGHWQRLGGSWYRLPPR